MSYPSRTLAVLAALPSVAVAFVAPLAQATDARAATEAYVSGEESGEIIVVDVDKGAVAARIPVGKRPRGIKLSRDGKLLYVALSGSPRGGPGVDESKLPPGDRTADGVGVVDPKPQAPPDAGERPRSRVVRFVARRQDALRLERGDGRNERARSPRGRSSTRSPSATSRRGSPSALTARRSTSPRRPTTRSPPSTRGSSRCWPIFRPGRARADRLHPRRQ